MNGKACMQVFPNSTLYDDNKVLEALLSGDVQLAAPSLSKFEKITKNVIQRSIRRNGNQSRYS